MFLLFPICGGEGTVLKRKSGNNTVYEKIMNIRPATEKDLPALERLIERDGNFREKNYFERCFDEQRQGKRQIFVMEMTLPGQEIIGYVQINWFPLYPLFRRMGMPEIQDLNVAPEHRRRGIGGKLIGHCEKIAKSLGKADIGISVGLDSSYGSAQRLYIRQGYMPDGAGVAYDEIPVRFGEMKAVDDQMTLKLTKTLV